MQVKSMRIHADPMLQKKKTWQWLQGCWRWWTCPPLTARRTTRRWSRSRSGCTRCPGSRCWTTSGPPTRTFPPPSSWRPAGSPTSTARLSRSGDMMPPPWIKPAFSDQNPDPIRSVQPDPDPDPGGKKWPTKNRKKCRNFMFWSAGCSLLRAEGFFRTLDNGHPLWRLRDR